MEGWGREEGGSVTRRLALGTMLWVCASFPITPALGEG